MPIEKQRFNTVADFHKEIGDPNEFILQGYSAILKTAGELLPFPQQVLYIDGITSSGKTTLLNNLAQALPEASIVTEFSSTPPQNYTNINAGTSLADQLRAELWFNSHYRNKAQTIQGASTPVIVDRGILGLFAYSNLLNATVSARVMRRAMQHSWDPGHYIFLTARPDVIRQRLLTRNDSAKISQG